MGKFLPSVSLSSSEHEVFDVYLTERQQFETRSLSRLARMSSSFAVLSARYESEQSDLSAYENA